jgi:hypothetical protein
LFRQFTNVFAGCPNFLILEEFAKACLQTVIIYFVDCTPEKTIFSDFNGLRGRQRSELPLRGVEVERDFATVNDPLVEDPIEVTERPDNNFVFFLPTQRPRDPLPTRNR